MSNSAGTTTSKAMSRGRDLYNISPNPSSTQADHESNSRRSSQNRWRSLEPRESREIAHWFQTRGVDSAGNACKGDGVLINTRNDPFSDTEAENEDPYNSTDPFADSEEQVEDDENPFSDPEDEAEEPSRRDSVAGHLLGSTANDSMDLYYSNPPQDPDSKMGFYIAPMLRGYNSNNTSTRSLASRQGQYKKKGGNFQFVPKSKPRKIWNKAKKWWKRQVAEARMPPPRTQPGLLGPLPFIAI